MDSHSVKLPRYAVTLLARVLRYRQHDRAAVLIDTLVAIAKDGQTDSSRLNAAVELLNRGIRSACPKRGFASHD
jgi:hypothetical protein